MNSTSLAIMEYRKIRKQKLTKAICFVSAGLGMLAAPISYAQTGEAFSGLEEVIVTARKRSESLQDVPLAVTAVTSDQLKINGSANIADIQSQIPGLTAYAARGTSNALTAYIRGVGQSDPLYGVEPGVGLYLDDVYIARPQGALLEIFDVDRIEVLRGPQGTLYGRNSIGGAIKYVSKALDNEPLAQAEVAVGSYGRRDASIVVGTPLIEDELQVKLGLLSRYRDGFGENKFSKQKLSDKQVLAANVVLQWTPNGDLGVKFTADVTKDTSAPPGSQRLEINPVEPLGRAITSGAIGPLPIPGPPLYSLAAVQEYIATNNITPLPVSNERYDSNSGLIGPHNDSLNSGMALTANYTINDDWDVKSITAFRKGETQTTIDFDTGPLPLADTYAEYDDEQFSQEIQFNYDNGADWQIVAGVYYLDGEAGGTGRSNFLSPLTRPGIPVLAPAGIAFVIPSYLSQRGNVVTESYAAYGEANWQIDDAWSLSFGGRYNWEKKEATIFAGAFLDRGFSIPRPGGPDADFTDSETWSNFSPKIGLDYQVDDNLLTYASVSQGFKSGGFNIRARPKAAPESAKPYDPEEVTSYELGFKSTLLDRFTLNAAYFYSDYEDIQLSVFTQLDDGSFFGDFTNAGKGVIQGVELEFNAPLNQHWSIGGNAAYIDAKYKEFFDKGKNIAEQQRFTNTPPWTATVNVAYRQSVADGELIAHLSGSYRGVTVPTTDLSETLTQPSYTTVDASVTYITNDGHWRLALEGRNLADTEYRTSGYDLNVFGSNMVQGFYGSPRTVALKLSYDL